MPTIHRHKGYRFFFFSNEGSPREPPHVHVERGDDNAKVWIAEDPLRLADSHGFSATELSDILYARRDYLTPLWLRAGR